MLAYKLIVLDLDGTLLPFDGAISDRTREVIERTKSAGIVVTLASGRPFLSLLPYIEELGISAPVVCNQGGQVVRPRTREVTYNAAIPLPQARTLLSHLQTLQIDVLVDTNGSMSVRPAKYSEQFYLDFVGRPFDLVTDLTARLGAAPAKVLIMDTQDENEQLLTELQERFGHLVRLLRSHPMFIEAIPLGVNKATALQRVAEELGIPRELTFAVGDAENDIEMVAWAGLGVAMGNASPSLKAVADYIAPSAEDDGAAQAIEKFCLNR